MSAGCCRVAIRLLLFAGCFLAFRFSPGYPQICDSRYSLLVARNLVETGDTTLDRFIPAELAARRATPGYVAETGLPYSILAFPVADGHVLYDGRAPANAETHYFYSYPLGSSVLAAPFVATSVPPADPALRAAWEDRIQLNVAALLCAWPLPEPGSARFGASRLRCFSHSARRSGARCRAASGRTPGPSFC